ncbi:MAG TPA: carbamoyltransferase C-terminal domain-containing protein [Streptosporangiaceae bacterium]|nr:carbamoyltransferase C-terminal domain-containing protein [Streptosporangiaceae bacterium]
MLVLGFSGLDRSLGVKERMVPGLDERERRYRQGMDSAVAIVSEDGVLAASAQERHDGVKTTGAFPADAIDACLRMAGVTLDDVDFVAHSFCYEPSVAHELDEFAGRWYDQVYSKEVQLGVLRARYPGHDWERKLVRVRHHLAHAASAYYLSGFDEAAVLVADGMGETESTSIMAGRGSELRTLRTYPISSSLGILYSVVTHYLGFLPGMDEYKVMGLAPYGDRSRFAGVARKLAELDAKGQLLIPVLSRDQSPTERETHQGVLNALEDLFGPARHPEAPVEQRHMDVAATLQDCLERSLLHVLAAARPQLGSARLCMAGGVALNCTANGLILRSGEFDDVFVQPAAGDDGTALGAALWQLHQHVPVTPARMTMPYWGDSASDEQIAEAVRGLGPGHEVAALAEDELVAAVAELIASGSIVAWFQGRMEFGPRALGNRSILADPTRPGMRAHLNAVVKQREEFRPFAPAVLAEEAGKYFDITPGTERTFEHMLFVAQVRDEYRDRLPAITHVDGSARLQVVRRDSAPLFWKLIMQAGRRLGVPIVLNTSFNLRGQPIIRTPAEAAATYARSAIDALAIGNWLVTRSPQAAGTALLGTVGSRA